MIKLILLTLVILFIFYYSLAVISAPITDEERIIDDEAQIEYLNKYINNK